MSRGFIAHLHPPEVSADTLRFRTTFGLGLTLIVLFLVTAVTGLFLMLYYVPSPAEARGTILDLEHAVTFGGFLRALHRIAGHAMVLVSLLHLLRVWLKGAFIGRALNWWVGLGLFLTTLGLAFTGYLLPWDQLSYWAVTVSANLADHVPLAGGALKRLLLGDTEVGGAALARFYALHTAVLPAAVVFLTGFHLFRLRRDGGLARANAVTETVPVSPHLLLREATLAVFVLLLLCIAAMRIPAPVGGPPDIHHPSDPEKTPWYFLFLQEMVSYSTPVGAFVFPMLLVALLVVSPLFDTNAAHRGRWCGEINEKRAFIFALLIGAVAFVTAEISFHTAAAVAFLKSASPLLRDLLNPATLMMLVALAAGATFSGRAKSRRAFFLATLTVLLVAVTGFTLMGACRGPGWVFYFPWEASHVP